MDHNSPAKQTIPSAAEHPMITDTAGFTPQPRDASHGPALRPRFTGRIAHSTSTLWLWTREM